MLLSNVAALQKSSNNVRILYLYICVSLQLSEYFASKSFVCRKDGYLFDKESILEYILTKKKEYARKLKEYEKQKQKIEVDKS